MPPPVAQTSFELPNELAEKILIYTSNAIKDYLPEVLTPTVFRRIQNRNYGTLHAALLVCRDWRRIALPLFYSTVILSRPEHVSALRETLRTPENRFLGKFITKLRVDDDYSVQSLRDILQVATNIVDLVLPLCVISPSESKILTEGLLCVNPSRLVLFDGDFVGSEKDIYRAYSSTRWPLSHNERFSFLPDAKECLLVWTNLKHLFIDFQSRRSTAPSLSFWYDVMGLYLYGLLQPKQIRRLTITPELFSADDLSDFVDFGVEEIEVFLWPPKPPVSRYDHIETGFKSNEMMQRLVESLPVLDGEVTFSEQVEAGSSVVNRLMRRPMGEDNIVVCKPRPTSWHQS